MLWQNSSDFHEHSLSSCPHFQKNEEFVKDAIDNWDSEDDAEVVSTVMDLA